MSSSYPVIRLIAALTLMTIAGSAMYSAIMVLEPTALEFGSGRGSASLPYASFMAGFAVGGVVMGRVADRYGILVPALLGSLALPAGFLLCVQATSILHLCVVLAVLCGFLGAAFSFGPLVADSSLWFTARRGLAVGIVISGNYLAGAVWPPILQHYFDQQGWRATFSDLSWFTLCTMLPLSLLLARRPPTETIQDATTKQADGHRPLAMTPLNLQCLICAAGVGCCVAMAMPQVHIVPYVLDLGYPAARGAEMLGLMLGFGVISRVGSGWLSDRIGGLKTLLIGSGLQTVVLIAFLGSDSLAWLYGVSIAFGLSQGGIVPSYAIILRTFFPVAEAGWRIGLALFFTIGGMALGGWIAGVLYDLTGSYTASFINAIAFNIFNLVIAQALLQRGKRPQTTTA
jgi:MFS family permease